MSPTTIPVTRERVEGALRKLGLIPFLGEQDQVAAILPSHVLRIVLPPDRPVQGIGEWSRVLDIRFAPQAAEFTASFNAATYLPKMATAVTDDGHIRFRLQHTFTWVAGADDEQVDQEVAQFVMASLAAFTRLGERFPDRWAQEADDE
ncbi:MAG: YbjN domain-containing protein [Pauljensenia sp.]|jgi:hypothetical protein